MPCPYAEKKGPIVYCKLTGKKVNPLAFPCLTNKYTKCKYYRKAQAEKAKPREEAERPVERARKQLVQEPVAASKPSQPSPASKPVQPAPSVETRPETKGMTIDGRRPRSCLECIYYGAKTSTCLLLGVTVKDPNNPPCAKT